MSLAVQFENVFKQYRLGEVGTGTLSNDLERIWAKLRGRPDPFEKVGQENKRDLAGGEYVWALRDMSFEIEKGEVLGIIGRNGAGKSTMLKLLSRIMAPTSGTIKTKGRIASLLEVGTGFHPELTGRENVFLNGAILGMTRREIAKQLDAIVDFSGCAKYIDTPVKRYSSGMSVRLGFAVAAHLTCEILVVDEVLAVGDYEFQTKCIGKMKDMSVSDNRTVLFVSHNLSAVRRLCTKSLVLQNGSISFCGPTNEAIDVYASQVRMASDVDIAECSQYGPQKHCKISRFAVRDENSKPSTVFRMGSLVNVLIDVECLLPLDQIEVGIKVSSVFGSPIHYFPSTWEGFTPSLKEGTHRFQVQLPNLLLLPGKYVFGAWVLRPGQTSDHNVGSITTIEIVGSDVNGFNADFARYSTGVGEVYAKSEWELLK